MFCLQQACFQWLDTLTNYRHVYYVHECNDKKAFNEAYHYQKPVIVIKNTSLRFIVAPKIMLMLKKKVKYQSLSVRIC